MPDARNRADGRGMNSSGWRGAEAPDVPCIGLIRRPRGASRARAGQDTVGTVGQDQGIDAQLSREAIHLALDGIETA